MSNLTKSLAALASGAVFGVGLSVSRMIDPAKVLGFLDLFGNWDPSLAFVMAGGLAVTTVAFALIKKRTSPFWHDVFHLPTKNEIDAKLVLGSALFGVGWGLVGMCPGPALANILLGAWQPLVFVGAMIAGMILHRLLPGKT